MCVNTPHIYIRDVTGPNEAKVGNIYFELQAKNDIFWQILGFCIY